MKVIIAGSRTVTSYRYVWSVFDACPWRDEITEIVSGGAKGVDTLARELAKVKGIPFREFPADWGAHGRAAGPIRNREMAEYADALIAIWDGKSRGAQNMIATMKRSGKPVMVAHPREVQDVVRVIGASEGVGRTMT